MYHLIAFLLGFFIDLLLGDPHGLPHPVCAIGKLIGYLEKKLLKEEDPDQKKRHKGVLLVILVLFCTTVAAGVILFGSYLLHPMLGLWAETVMTWQILAVKSLQVESMKVYRALKTESLQEGRQAVSMIVGRDTANLDEAGVIRACVETIAENTSDGSIAPMLYLALGGPVLGFFYKAINTMDSMVGYQNDKYLHFGRAAAKLDDLVNWIPSRLCAGLMLVACLFGKEFDKKQAWKIYKRDRRNHKSPNSAQTEAVCAGALGLRLAGPSFYFGKKVEKPYIGDAIREIEPEDIVRANRLMILTAWLCEIVCWILIGGFVWVRILV